MGSGGRLDGVRALNTTRCLQRTRARTGPGRKQSLTDFKIDDRVRVRDLPAVGSYAGQVGVVGVGHSPAGALYAYYVKLDGSLSGSSSNNGIAVAPHELE